MTRALFLSALALCALAIGCASSRPHALDYVVLPNHDNGRKTEPSPEVVKNEAKLNGEHRYPIYDDAADHGPQLEPGSGGAGCGVGLIGAQCERGLLEDETPLSDRELLGPDDQVIEDG